MTGEREKWDKSGFLVLLYRRTPYIASSFICCFIFINMSTIICVVLTYFQSLNMVCRTFCGNIANDSDFPQPSPARVLAAKKVDSHLPRMGFLADYLMRGGYGPTIYLGAKTNLTGRTYCFCYRAKTIFVPQKTSQ